MIQVIPRLTYNFDYHSFILLLKSLPTNNKRSNLKNILKDPFPYQYIIDCDDKNKINIYFKSNNEENEMILKRSLSSFAGGKADIITANNIREHYVFNTLYKSDTLPLTEFNNINTFNYILSVFSANTRLTINFKPNMNSNDSELNIECSIITSCFKKESIKELSVLTNTIIKLTQAEGFFKAKYKLKFTKDIIKIRQMINIMQIPSLSNRDSNSIEFINKLFTCEKSLNENEFSQGLEIGRLKHPAQKDRPVKIDIKKLSQHVFISGQTGAGKSSALEEIIKSIINYNIENPKECIGFTFFDPAELSALGVIDIIEKFKSDGIDVKNLYDKIHYIDFDDNDMIFPINLLNNNDDHTQIIDFFKSLYGDNQTVQIDRFISNCLTVLLNDTNTHTIDDVIKILVDNNYRQSLITSIGNNVYLSEQITFLNNEKFNQNQIDPILNRLDPFLNTQTKKLMFSCKKYDRLKDITKWMDEGHIVIFNLRSMSDFDLKVIVGFLALNYHLKAQKRGLWARRHFLIIDESHKVQLPILNNIISEDRKFGLSLVLSTQYIEQYNQELLKTILNNIATKITFRLGEEPPSALVSQNKKEVLNFPDRVGLLNTEDNKTIKSVLIECNPPYRYNNGKLVNYLSSNDVNANNIKNRIIVKQLYEKDGLHKSIIEKEVFKMKKDIIYENSLISDGFDIIWDNNNE